MITCFDVANYFINVANETGSYVSNLKLQKLVYYAQAWYLALYGEPLFEEDFQAWVHGPVIPELYNEYKSFRWKPIDKEVNGDDLNIPDYVLSYLEEVTNEYFSYDAYDLEKMTHIEDPWKKARGNLPIDEPSQAIIEKDWMKEFYSSCVQE
ncbi:Panacea domain-containing protein [Gloeocapsa sp. PCC 73106]|uniref:Panacea domain-containing protein n=1 Tax=Gloeocapsa sp. PCC 73106 TaxID=102232 RepID=UPI0002AC1A9B|nr:type II toxin-antitoxin system antitoxin SocA domain-containing protein [Gloeocapsa sp. PCC 73106]ELR96863.1 putative phage-associated protein [Gloeocapsa sp. PCC 73106]